MTTTTSPEPVESAWVGMPEGFIDPPEPEVIPACPPWCCMVPGHLYIDMTDDRRGVVHDHNSSLRDDVSLYQEETYVDGLPN